MRVLNPRLRAIGGLLVGLVAAGASAVVVSAPASAAVPGLVYITAHTGFDSSVYKSVTALCPEGTRLVGGGWEVVGAPGEIVMDDFIPSARSLLVGAGEIVGPGERSDGTTQPWAVVAMAVCANPPPGYQIVASTSAFAPGGSRTALVSCPVGKALIGAGASLSNGFGQISVAELYVADDFAQATAVDDEDGYSGSWSVTAYAICADPLPGLQITFDQTTFTSSSSKEANAGCPAGKRLLGAGWSVFGGSETSQLLAIFVNVFGHTTPPSVRTVGTVDANGFSGGWWIKAQAICANA
jgi:hypothetical protein